MAENGRLPASMLADIPGGRLRKDAAASWNAMRQFIGEREGVWLMPTSRRTAYRTYEEQVYFWNLYLSGDGALAARPGYSNHGLGIAVDTPTYAMQAAIRKWGHLFGWGIRGGRLSSDAPSESWHATFHPGVWKPTATKYPTIRKGSHGAAVKRLQVLLRDRKGKHYLPQRWHAHESYTITVRRAVRKFQKEHGLPVDGVVGPKTWRALRA